MLFTISVNAQDRTCGSTELMEELLKDPEFKRKHETKLRQAMLMAEQKVETRAACSNPVIIPVAVHYQRLKRNEFNTTAERQCLINQALDQIRILNEDYQGMNADISNWTGGASSLFNASNGEACIEFCLATKSHPSGYDLSDGDYAVTFNQTSGDRASAFSGYINIFVRSINYLGYSPLGGAGNGDGVVIDNNAFGSGSGCGSVSPNSPYNLGRTLTHELGHYLLLDHIWGSGCNVDDNVSDTPDQSSEYYGCPSLNQSSCGSNDMHMNYMDYTNDACMYMFSAGQATRMENYVSANLSNVVAKGQQVCGSGGPTEPTCTDGVQNGDEEGIDCGGSNCAPCEAEPTCTDGVQNGDEEGVDCGGSNCAPCETEPTCSDGIQNGDETGVDCGGSCNACPTTSCDAPTGLFHQSRKGGRQARLSWDAVGSADSYEIQVRPSGGSWTTFTQSSTTITLNVTRGASYDWQVRAICGGDPSDWSSASFTAGQSGRLSSANFDDVNVYPNPANNMVNIYLDLVPANEAMELAIVEDNNTFTGTAQLSVLDLTGRMISTRKVNNYETTELNVSDLTPGMYFIRVDYDGVSSVKKFVVKH